MALREQARSVTVDEYFALLEKSDVKLELSGGRIVAMSGGSRNHSIIQINTTTTLRTQLRKKGCVVHGSEMQVRAGEGKYYFPDGSVVCGEEQFERRHGIDVLLNPVVIIEVLSPTTEDRDREDKFEDYKKIATLQHYVLIAQHKPRVECYTRSSVGWVSTIAFHQESSILLQAVNSTLDLSILYEDARFTDDPALENGATNAND